MAIESWNVPRSSFYKWHGVLKKNKTWASLASLTHLLGSWESSRIAGYWSINGLGSCWYLFFCLAMWQTNNADSCLAMPGKVMKGWIKSGRWSEPSFRQVWGIGANYIYIVVVNVGSCSSYMVCMYWLLNLLVDIGGRIWYHKLWLLLDCFWHLHVSPIET